MNKKSNYKNSLKLILEIQNIRKKNNVNWMDMLRLAFKHDPDSAAGIMSNIYTDDQRVSNLVKKLIKSTK
jgi:hypothetical protein|tara:strand:- start:1 stop:210 length:210 start_codon:yes stop_codon:yes gene_type:complete